MQYMDRIYVKHHNKAPVHDLGLTLWRDHVVRRAPIKDRILNILLDMVYRERSGEIIDRALVRSVTQVRGGNAFLGLPILTNANTAIISNAYPCMTIL